MALLCVATVIATCAPAFPAGFGAYIVDVKPADVFPNADRFSAPEGQPPAMAAYKADKVVGYVFETSDVGYSGKPIRILAGLDLNGVFTGAKVKEHHEPILLVGISPEKLYDFVGRFAGRSVVEMSKETSSKQVDVISGATVTAIVINDGMMRTALALAKSRGIAGFPPIAVSAANSAAGQEQVVLADIPYAEVQWSNLLQDGSVGRLRLINRDVDAEFAKIGVGSPEPYAKAGVPDQDFIDLYAGMASIETIGRSLLSETDYQTMKAWLGAGHQALLLAANGDYSFHGSGYVRGGIFDRIQVVQGDQTILFKDKDHRRLDRLGPANPAFKEIGIFRLPDAPKFNAAEGFRIELLAQRPTGPIEKAFTSFSLVYQLPAKFLKKVAAAAPAASANTAATESSGSTASSSDHPLWQKIWAARAFDIAILTLALTVLTLIFFFQDWLVKRRVLFARLRTGFLIFSVVWLGLYAKAQLSVVNVLTFTNAILTGFRWDFFLLEPLIFILWCATAASLLFWGRGAFCGWLCPFGALQELLNHAARRLGIQQYNLPFYIHERLWALKYVLFLGLFGVALGNMATAEQLSEIEPFKTAIVLRFMREWWFVLFALSLLVAGLFIERFYCRYLCVLGAALAIPGRGRMFDWLKRRKQCGFECQLCAKQCTVQAIHPLGQINPHECIYCMHCQVIYWDDHQCPPLVLKREGRGKKTPAAKAQGVPPVTAQVKTSESATVR